MTNRKTKTGAELALESWQLSMEAGSVMWLRGMRIMSGGKLAERETERMIREKMVANMMLWPALMTGGFSQTAEQLGERTLAHYRKPVRANKRRLSRRK